MARDAKTHSTATKAATVKTASEPKELYDTLTPSDQQVWDKIGSLGYVPEQGTTGLWLAKKRSNPSGLAVGPANNLKDLLSRVKSDIAGDEEFNSVADLSDEELTDSINNDIDGGDENAEGEHPDGYLFQEMKPKRQVVIPELRQPILNYESFKEERIQALAKEVEWKKEIDKLLHIHKDHLAFDPKSGVHSYRLAIDGGNDIIVELIPGEEKLKTRRASDGDDE